MTNTIEKWLDNSVKNEYYHINLTTGIGADHEYFRDWRNAVTQMREGLTSEWSKEEYLSWTRNWKSVYAKLTSESRWSKKYRSINRLIEITGVTPRALAENLSSLNITHEHWLCDFATELMQIRTEAKELAEIAYLASHAEKKRVLETA